MPVSRTEQWIDWALGKVEKVPVIGGRVSDYRQERQWNNPEAVVEHAEWDAERTAYNDALDRANDNAYGPAPPVGNVRPRDFTSMITTALEESGLDASDQIQALALIDNAAVYLHQADVTNRLARTALPGSISAEWNQLGLTESQAREMIDKAIGYIHDQSAFDRDYAAAERENEAFDKQVDYLADREWMTPDEWAANYQDTGNDYAEAYADVAGDATLSWRLEEEDPRDILNDVKRQAHREVFGLTVEKPGKTDPVDLFLDALTEGLAERGVTIREVSPPDHDTGHDTGIS